MAFHPFWQPSSIYSLFIVIINCLLWINKLSLSLSLSLSLLCRYTCTLSLCVAGCQTHEVCYASWRSTFSMTRRPCIWLIGAHAAAVATTVYDHQLSAISLCGEHRLRRQWFTVAGPAAWNSLPARHHHNLFAVNSMKKNHITSGWFTHCVLPSSKNLFVYCSRLTQLHMYIYGN